VKHLILAADPRDPPIVAKPELGTKRLCANCGAKFYDLDKDPITCPKCHTVMEVAAVTTRPTRPEAQGKKGEGEAAEGTETEEEVELEDEPMDDAAFIEEQEEGDEDVTDIIGDREEEEEG